MIEPEIDTDQARIDIESLFGEISLRPHYWVIDDRGRIGRQYLRVDYDRHGNETARKILEPVGWLSLS